MFRAVDVSPLPNLRLHIRYADGVEGDVDLSTLAGKGVFALWNDPGTFEKDGSAVCDDCDCSL